jgi:hypothetical protein
MIVTRTLLTVSLATMVAAACGTSTAPDMPPASMNEPPAPSTPPEPPLPPSPPPPQTARYRVTFDARWNRSTHPVDFPASAHFSPLVGANHDASLTLWREGGPASQGIREMAEMGRTIQIERDVAAAVSAGSAERSQVGPAVNAVPATVAIEITVSQRFPLYTLVTMVAPSPDWFVGVAGVPLFDNGEWVPERTYQLDAWDAGTDSGQSFSSADVVTSPQGVITRIVTAPLAPNGQTTPLGSFTFTRIE